MSRHKKNEKNSNIFLQVIIYLQQKIFDWDKVGNFGHMVVGNYVVRRAWACPSLNASELCKILVFRFGLNFM